MKKLLIALSAMTVFAFNAEAQSKFDKNYKICKSDDAYKVCNTAEMAKANTEVGREGSPGEASASLRLLDSHTHLGYTSTPVTSKMKNPRIRVSIDDPNAPYQGEESMANDGVQKNKTRNINYLDASVILPPVDGRSGARR